MFQPAKLVFQPAKLVFQPAKLVFQPAKLVFQPAKLVFQPAKLDFGDLGGLNAFKKSLSSKNYCYPACRVMPLPTKSFG